MMFAVCYEHALSTRGGVEQRRLFNCAINLPCRKRCRSSETGSICLLATPTGPYTPASERRSLATTGLLPTQRATLGRPALLLLLLL